MTNNLVIFPKQYNENFKYWFQKSVLDISIIIIFFVFLEAVVEMVKFSILVPPIPYSNLRFLNFTIVEMVSGLHPLVRLTLT